MTTQYERDQIRRSKEAARLLALVEAALAQPDPSPALTEAAAVFNVEAMRRGAEWDQRQEAQRQAERDRIAEGERAFAELPDAPERRQCEAHVARNEGRWTSFGRCEKAATRIIMDYKAKRERCVCTVHAKEFATEGKAGTGFGRVGKGDEVPTHESWYRIKGWCMAPDPAPADRRRPTRFCRVKVDQGSGRHDGKEHKWS